MNDFVEGTAPPSLKTNSCDMKRPYLDHLPFFDRVFDE